MGVVALIAGSLVGAVSSLVALMLGAGWGTAIFIYFGMSIASAAMFLRPLRLEPKRSEPEDVLDLWRQELGFHPDGRGPITLQDHYQQAKGRRAA